VRLPKTRRPSNGEQAAAGHAPAKALAATGG